MNDKNESLVDLNAIKSAVEAAGFTDVELDHFDGPYLEINSSITIWEDGVVSVDPPTERSEFVALMKIILPHLSGEQRV